MTETKLKFMNTILYHIEVIDRNIINQIKQHNPMLEVSHISDQVWVPVIDQVYSQTVHVIMGQLQMNWISDDAE